MLLLIAPYAFTQATQASANDDIVVVVNNKNPVDKMTRSEVIDLFMGKYVAFPDGNSAIPVELSNEVTTKEKFYKALVNMPLSRINAYWSRLRFTGRKRTVTIQASEDNVVQYINKTQSAIGYIRRSKLNKNLKVVFELNE